MSAVPSVHTHIDQTTGKTCQVGHRQTSRGHSGRTRVYEHTSSRTRKLSDDAWHEFLHFRPQKWSLIRERPPSRSIHRWNLRHWRCIVITTVCACLCMHACAPRNKILIERGANGSKSRSDSVARRACFTHCPLVIRGLFALWNISADYLSEWYPTRHPITIPSSGTGCRSSALIVA